ncbi:MAG: 16S rRNA (guanine(527)-N(7))-methyltransferase RsmG [Eubacterium sp.]|nr:16S rRNA (guanine(527)-N(7))-methyltransferase RsmG [Eubacterium sp.]
MENLSTILEKLNIPSNDTAEERLDKYYHMVVEKNKVMNLTAITEEHEFLIKHFADSLSVYSAVPLFKEMISSGKCTLIDVGTGAGFPGIPLKIIFPEIEITLLDSLQKRVNFLNEVVAGLGLDGITAVHSRAEDGARDPKLRDGFDLVVSRAVASLPVLSEYCLPYVKPGGLLIAYKSGDIKEELEGASHALKVLGGKLCDSPVFTLPDSDISRSFVVVKKLKLTPKAYPRKAGAIKKEPL